MKMQVKNTNPKEEIVLISWQICCGMRDTWREKCMSVVISIMCDEMKSMIWVVHHYCLEWQDNFCKV